MKIRKYILLFTASALMTACGTQKTVVSTGTTLQKTATDDSGNKKLSYIRKVYDNATYSKNIVSKIDFTIDAMGKNISVDGKLQMRKNEVIRITLSPLGLLEVGRVEFTPDYVLIIDRMHKQYVKATYNDLDFLKNNGLTFYSLQALFWNELFLPGTDKLTEAALSKFDTDLTQQTQRKVTAATGSLNFTWTTTVASGRIDATSVKYATGTTNASTASWTYTGFSALGSKQFPTDQTISFASKALNSNATQKVNIKLKKLTIDSDWETKTTVSDKYTKVTPEEALKKLVSF